MIRLGHYRGGLGVDTCHVLVLVGAIGSIRHVFLGSTKLGPSQQRRQAREADNDHEVVVPQRESLGSCLVVWQHLGCVGVWHKEDTTINSVDALLGHRRTTQHAMKVGKVV